MTITEKLGMEHARWQEEDEQSVKKPELKQMTKTEAIRVLEDPATHTLVRQVLKLAEHKDPVDAYYDLLLAATVFGALRGVNQRCGEART